MLKLKLSQLSESSSCLWLSSLPVGSLLPWLCRIKAPDGTFKISPDLPPAGWQLCDGQVH